MTTSAFHFFDQPAALREFHRVLASGGLVAVATLSARQPLLQASSANRWKPQHNPSPAEMRACSKAQGSPSETSTVSCGLRGSRSCPT